MVSDIPLLFEVLDPAAFDVVVLVEAPEQVRLRQSLISKVGKHMRRMPELQFFLDDTIDEMYRVDALLNRIEKKD